MNLNPKARSQDLVVQAIDCETLIYDLRTQKAHCLNATASFVWNHLDGDLSVSELVSLANSRLGHPIPPESVELAITQLRERELLDGTFAELDQITRREVLQRIGLASAVALPVVSSLVVPPNAFSIASNCSCTASSQCAGRACPSTTRCNQLGLCAPNV